MPHVSVLVPAYNAVWCLGEALDSIVAQRYQSWEAIVVDDGSTDDTALVARGRDPRIRVVRSETNRGLAAARNLALQHATGELIALLDSDDVWLPEYLDEQVRLHARTAAQIVCCDAYLRQAGYQLAQTYGDRFGRPDGAITVETLIRTNPIFVSVLVERSAVEAVGGFDASLRSVEDLDLWLRIVERGGQVAYQPRPLAVYRLTSGSLSTDTLRMTRSRQQVLQGALDRGHLNPRARRLATRAKRLQRAAKTVEVARRDTVVRGAARLARSAPLLFLVAVERLVSS